MPSAPSVDRNWPRPPWLPKLILLLRMRRSGPSHGRNHPMPPPTVSALAPYRMRGKAPAVTRAAVHRAELPPAMMAPAATLTTAPLRVRLAEALEGAAAAAAPPAQRRAATPQVTHPQAATPQVAVPHQLVARPTVLHRVVPHPAVSRLEAVRLGEIRPVVRLPAPACRRAMAEL